MSMRDNIFMDILMMLITLFIVLIFGIVIYSILDGLRIEQYCPTEHRSEGSCYAPEWNYISHWVASITGSLMAIISILLFSFICSKKPLSAAKFVLIVGLVVAVPFALLSGSLWAYLSTALTGIITLAFVKYLTSR